jgi:catechol 2,3-dioxygenase-like lactoylglutathione lyase family enzyme
MDKPVRSVRATHLGLRGVNHLALVTEDMKATMDFYADILGIRLVHAMKVSDGLGTGPANRGNPPFERLRHYFFDMGNDESLAFFEMPKGAKTQTDRDALGGMQHVSFTTSRSGFDEVRRRMDAKGIPYLGPIDIFGNRAQSMYFFDPSEIRLEVTWHRSGPEDPAVIDDLVMTKAKARVELATLCDDAAWIEHHVAHLPE